ncbi:5-oxoprolinase subunit PxpA [Shewanella mesophila]|uniref:5-oxoprolinase subunit PxpA n=1 Tax=Shewanella mesophila TaxID=2864208 RepID=UPI001C6569A9|nr:5-oxoprolinase subunit PxpA [Shewanella mesophila]QYJ86211.1 5-oxoprolinase subunit PxpA [Shewanella mesophila]
MAVNTKQIRRRYPIDLNADLGEGGVNDQALLQMITSANIACGGHAGDQTSMRQTVKLAKQYNVLIGAHPSYPDRANFGRQTMELSPNKLLDSLYGQITALKQICDTLEVKLHHVKPHGALYNQAADNSDLGQIIIDAIKRVDPNLKLMMLAGSSLVQQARAQGIEVIEEAFADRAYLASGALASRRLAGAVIETPQTAMKQVENIINGQPIATLDCGSVIIKATSICLHGDNEHALAFAKLISRHLYQSA